MYRTRMLRAMFVVILIGTVTTRAAIGQEYAAALRTVASDLVNKLAAANQRSGTVIDFTDLQGTPNELGRFLAQELSDQLVSAGKSISFVDRANMQMLLRENKLSVEGLVNPETTKKLGKLIGIDTVVFGTVTPLGNVIRLSVRAVSVETGRIIAAASTNLPGAGLGDMYTRGVANGSENVTSAPTTQPSDVRSRFRGDSIRLTGREIVIEDSWYCGGNAGQTCASATLTLENLSGIGFDAGLVANSFSIGNCTPTYDKPSGLARIHRSNGSGPTYTYPGSGDDVYRYIPSGGKLVVTIAGFPCDPGISAWKSADVAASLSIKANGQTFDLPISASGVLVHAQRK